jgi:hypothetical protein
MNLNYNQWEKLFLFALGLFIGTAFCMKWMESDFFQNGQKFTIIGLELFYPKEKVAMVLSDIDEHVKTILRYHLSFDFVFMAGLYPGIAALCMMARVKTGINKLKKMLTIFAVLQLIAWGCDIAENLYLLKWVKNSTIGNDFGQYHFIVTAKWIIAITGVLISIPFALRRRKLT